MTCQFECIFALVRLFSTVIFQMCPKIFCTRSCIITLFVQVKFCHNFFNVCIGTFTQRELSCASSSCVHQKTVQRIFHMMKAFLQQIVTMWTFKFFRHEKTFPQHVHLSALSAEIRPLPTVSFHVHFQVVSTRKRFSTQFTCRRLFSCVS